jgi:ABC-type Fe3+/spermidine/putrescine transport system ATPase subunit
MSLLEIDHLRVAFGGVVAVDDVSMQVDAGTMVGLIGPNGAGKSTCIEALTGYVPQATGRVVFDGHDLRGRPPHRRARLGLVRTFQAVELFDDLTVRDNLRPRPTRGHGGSRSATSSRRDGTTTSRPSRPRSSSSACPTWPANYHPSFPKGSGNSPVWPGRSPAARVCCCSTSRPPDLTPPRASSWANGCGP